MPYQPYQSQSLRVGLPSAADQVDESNEDSSQVQPVGRWVSKEQNNHHSSEGIVKRARELCAWTLFLPDIYQ